MNLQDKPPTKTEIREFWKHNVHPITGHKYYGLPKQNPINIGITASERDHHNYYENVAWK